MLLSSIQYRLFHEKSPSYSFYYQTLSISLCAVKQSFSHLQLWFVFFPQFKHFTLFFIYEKLRKVVLEYYRISKRYLQQGLQENLGKVSSLLKNVRNFKHVSKNQGIAPPSWSAVLKRRSLQADASKITSVSSEVMADGEKICCFETNWTIFSVIYIQLPLLGTSDASCPVP